MKKYNVLFLVITITALISVPSINLWLGFRNDQAIIFDSKTWSKDALYNMDFASRWINRFLYPYGISLDADNVIIGKEGWLFLGDGHRQVRTVTRMGSTDEDTRTSRQIEYVTREWERWLKSQGVKQFTIMVGPNKDTIYPEYLPDWAQPTRKLARNTFFSVVDNRRYIDLAIPLRQAKANTSVPLYYQTDTHWTPLGAGIAFRYFAEFVAASQPGLNGLADSQFSVQQSWSKPAGDLATFLRLHQDLTDTEIKIKAYDYPTTITRYDFTSGKKLYEGANIPLLTPFEPERIISSQALNQSRVLWLRDSFGTALSPLMAATFSDTVQIFQQIALQKPARFIGLVQQFKPEYVFITVVERDSRQPVFTNRPPELSLLNPELSQLVAPQPLRLARTHHFEKIENMGKNPAFRVLGSDSFWVFDSNFKLSDFQQPYLQVDIKCMDQPNGTIPVQFFWQEEDMPHYSEEKSVREHLRPGANFFDLKGLFGLDRNKRVIGLRLDTEAGNHCSGFSLTQFALGEGQASAHPETPVFDGHC